MRPSTYPEKWMPCEHRMKSNERSVMRCDASVTRGNYCAKFHHPWCNSSEIAEKLCERGIATTSKCATIGTVQEISCKFRASHANGFYSTPRGRIFRGRPAATGSRSSESGREARCFAPRESRCLKSANEPPGAHAGGSRQGLHDGICDFAGFGTQSLAPDSRGTRKESHPAVV